ncbi:hypothetical protein GOICGAJE_02529 [Bacillus sp. MB95]|nr:hypothetical protein [Bacillus sp. MB95]
MGNCIICNKHINKDSYNAYESEYIVVSHGPLASKVKGYFYIEFKRHVERWSELSFEEIIESSRMVQLLDEFLQGNVYADRVYTVSISEAVRHLHIHVIPRKINTEMKGLDLIQQATQPCGMLENDLSNEEIVDLVNKANKFVAEKLSNEARQ